MSAYKLTERAVGKLKRLYADYYGGSRRKPGKRDLLPTTLPLPWFGIVTGVEIDQNTGSCVVAVRKLLSFMPFHYDQTPGSEQYAWAGFDSLPKQGNIVKVSPMSNPTEEPYRLFAEIIIAARQDTLPFPDAACVAKMLAPCVPLNPSTSCLLAPVVP